MASKPKVDYCEHEWVYLETSVGIEKIFRFYCKKCLEIKEVVYAKKKPNHLP